MTIKIKRNKAKTRREAKANSCPKITPSPSSFQFNLDTKIVIKTEDVILFSQDQVSLDMFIAIYQKIFKVEAPKVIDLGNWDGDNCEQPHGDTVQVPFGYLHTRLEFPRLPENQEVFTISGLSRQISIMNNTLTKVCKEFDMGCIFHNFEFGTSYSK